MAKLKDIIDLTSLSDIPDCPLLDKEKVSDCIMRRKKIRLAALCWDISCMVYPESWDLESGY